MQVDALLIKLNISLVVFSNMKVTVLENNRYLKYSADDPKPD